jgi:ribosomal protein L31
MKSGIHPTMHEDAKTTCSTCGTVFMIPSTIKDQTVEICRNCHPVYTGKQQKDLRGGRVDRFKKRAEATAAKKQQAA